MLATGAQRPFGALASLLAAAALLGCPQPRGGGAVAPLQHDVAIEREFVRDPHDLFHPRLLDLYQKPYDFSRDMFSSSLPQWEPVLEPFKGKPGLRYVEVGLFEGSSLFWMLENVLTHPTSRAVGIDAFFQEDYASKFRNNLALSGHEDRVTVIEALSEDALKTLERDSFDLAYIDGSHRSREVLVDAILTWGLLKDGGILIFDDYRQEVWYDGPTELAPTLAVDAFVSAYRNDMEVLHRGYQLIVRKRTILGTLAEKGYDHNRLGANCWYSCLRIKDHVFHWGTGLVLDLRSGEIISLPPQEVEAVRELLRMRRLAAGRDEFVPADLNPLRSKPAFASVLKQLGL